MPLLPFTTKGRATGKQKKENEKLSSKYGYVLYDVHVRTTPL